MNEAERFLDKVERPVGTYLLIRKCARGEQIGNEFMDGGIILPDTTWDDTNFCSICGVGPDCKLFTEDMLGSTTWCPEAPNSLSEAGCPESFYFVKEEDLVPLLFDDSTITPIKDMVLVAVKPLTIDGLELTQKNNQYDPWGFCISVGPCVRDILVGFECLVSEKSFVFMVGGTHVTCIPEHKIAAVQVPE